MKPIDTETRPAILIVDDEERMRDCLAQMAARLRCTPLVARSPDRAFEIVASARVDLILLDLHMPGESGLDLLERLRRKDLMRPTIVVSGYVSADIAQQVIAAGVSGIVAKPFRLGRLIQEIRRVVTVGDAPEVHTPEAPACRSCGRRGSEGDRFCAECGGPLRAVAAPQLAMG